MIAKNMEFLVKNSSAIRAMFEEGKKMAAEVGPENVFDFSLGNPNVPAPEEVGQAVRDLINEGDPVSLHGYMNNAGFEDVRQKVAENLNRRFGTSFAVRNILMTVGAAGGLNVILKALLDPGSEVLVFAPFFGEYRWYVQNHGGVLVTVPAELKKFQLDLESAEKLITEKTRAVILNKPNNPSGLVYS